MSWLPYITMFLLGLVGVMLIFIILLQRGRGGGLAGALGGMGGQSAFGTKAGDVFTKITIGLATVWMLLAATNVFALRFSDKKYTGGSEAVSTAPGLEAADKEKVADDKEIEEITAKLKQLGGMNKNAENAEEQPAATETKADEDKKPAESTTPEKKPEEQPAEEKPAEKPAAAEDAAKTEKPAEPAAKDETKPE